MIVKDEQRVEMENLKRVTLFSLAVSTFSILTAITVVPMIYNYVQHIESSLQSEVNFCRHRSNDLWEQYFISEGIISMRGRNKRDTRYRHMGKSSNHPTLVQTRASEPYSEEWQSDGSGYGTDKSSSSVGTDREYNPSDEENHEFIGNSEELSRSEETEDADKGSEHLEIAGNNGRCCSCRTGPPGPVGPPGIRGNDGKDGKPGLNGVPGVDGMSSEQFVHDFCFRCPPGIPGDVGPPGPKGPKGPNGASGPNGATPLPGPAGACGPPGPVGIPGPPGPRGNPGPPGQITEVVGPFGPPGLPGPTGPPGPMGEKGINGKKGQPGPQGPSGEKGKDGAAGKEGKIGIQGIAGERGPTGSCDHCPIPRTPPGY